MKYIISATILAIILIIIAPVKGDVNIDGAINEQDAEIVKEYILGERELSKTQLYLADMNNDGEVNITDFLQIKGQLRTGEFIWHTQVIQ